MKKIFDTHDTNNQLNTRSREEVEIIRPLTSDETAKQKHTEYQTVWILLMKMKTIRMMINEYALSYLPSYP